MKNNINTDSWVSCKVGDLLKLKNGYAFKSSKYDNEGIPVIRIGDINEWKVETTKAKRIKEDEEYDDHIVNKGDILIAMSGATTGKFGIYDSNEKAYQNQRVGNLIPHSNTFTSKKYIYYLLYSLKREIEKKAYGGAQPNISGKKIEELETKLFPLPIQHALVRKIESLFSSLDSGITDLKKAQEQLKTYRQAVLKKAFEGELTKEWRKNNLDITESFEVLQELKEERKTKPYKKGSIYYKKITDNFKFSKHKKIKSWSIATLNNLIYIAARIGWRGLKKDEYTEKGPLFLSVYSLNYGKYVDFRDAFHISEERYEESPEIKLQNDDVLLCKDGAGIGKIGIVRGLVKKGTVNSSILVIRGMKILNQEFLYYLFSGPKLQSIVFERITGSTTPHLFQRDIKEFELPLPPIQEQNAIVREIESRLSVCDAVEENIKESLEKAEQLRQSILKKAFSGALLSEKEIKECRNHPDYEPAAELLKRIKADKKK